MKEFDTICAIATALGEGGIAIIRISGDKALDIASKIFRPKSNDDIKNMIAGNMFGIPLSAYESRRRGKPFKGSTLGYELGMLIWGILVLPFAMLHALLRWIVGMPKMRFEKNK